MAERLELAVHRESDEAAQTTSRHVLEEDAFDRILRAEAKDLLARGIDELHRHAGNSSRGPSSAIGFGVPIHLRAEPGDYAEACLLPGDPLRAKYIADTFLTDVVQVNAERGLLGFTGRWEGKPISVQGTGMGCPSATIVFEELIQLGVTRLLRVGTCGGLQSDHALGDLIVALSAVPADSTATHLVLGEPHCPTASWELIHEAVHVAKHSKETLRVGPDRLQRSLLQPRSGPVRALVEARDPRGGDGVRCTVHPCGPARVHAGCLLTVSDIHVEGEFVRIEDDELRAAVDRMTRIALETATAGHGH